MRFEFLTFILKLALTALLLSVSVALGETVTVNVTPNRKACTVVHLPRWKKPLTATADRDWGENVGMGCDLDFRSSDSGVQVGSYCQPGRYTGRIYSPDKYAVSFGSGRIRKITDSEWDHADRYLNFRDSPVRSDELMKDDDTILYKGKPFPRTGSRSPGEGSDMAGRISQDGSFLAVNSWDGIIAISEPLMFGRRQFDGHYYVDIYNVDSGQKALAVSGEFHGVDPHIFFEKSAWISKYYFVLPLDGELVHRRFIICDVEVSRPAQPLGKGSSKCKFQ